MKLLWLNLFLGTMFLFAQSDANSLLRELQNKYNSISDLSVNYSQTINDKTVLSGKIFFKKENKYRVENKNQILGSDGQSTWNYNPKQKKFILSNYDNTANSIYSINYLVYQLPSECTLSARSSGQQRILELTPRTSNLQYSKIELWINSENLISKIVLYDYNNQITNINLSNYNLNQNISDDKFSFNPPEGTRIIDLR